MPYRFGVVSIRIMVFFLSDRCQAVLPDVVANGAFAAGVAEGDKMLRDLPAQPAGSREPFPGGSGLCAQLMIQTVDFFRIPVEDPGRGLASEVG